MTVEPEDLVWISRFVAGDEAAFAWVVERYQHSARRHASTRSSRSAIHRAPR